MTAEIVAFDHVQLAMPAGQEDVARSFYCDVLGMVEEPKPPALQARGGLWLKAGACRLHLGVDSEFRPARKAHPALIVRGLAALVRSCAEAGVETHRDEPLKGIDRIFVFDPFGNRIELVEHHDG